LCDARGVRTKGCAQSDLPSVAGLEIFQRCHALGSDRGDARRASAEKARSS
jgi:hypothetical protein